jgi:hypothetical protein
VTTDTPDKKTLLFRIQGAECDETGGNGAFGGAPAFVPLPRGGGQFSPTALVCPQIQAEMVISYDVQ